MKCKECGGEIDKAKKIMLKTSCGGGGCGCAGACHEPTYPCKRCGLLHFENGNYAINRQTGAKVYYLGEGDKK